MKRILFACGTGVATSAMVRARVEELLNEMGYAGAYESEQCAIADVHEREAAFDFTVSPNLKPDGLTRPYVYAYDILAERDETAVRAELKAQMEA